VRAPRRHGAARRPAGLAVRHRLAGRRHLVAVHQHAPLRRPAGLAGRAGGAAAGRVPVAVPRAGHGSLRAPGRAHPAVAAAGVRRGLVAGRAGAGRAVHRLSVGGRGLCPCRGAAVDARALRRGLRHRLRRGLDRRRRGPARRHRLGAEGMDAAGRRAAAVRGGVVHPARLHRAHPDADRDPAAGQRAAGREVLRRPPAARAGLVRRRAGQRHRRPGRHPRDGHPAAAAAAAAGLLGGARAAFRAERDRGVDRHPAGQLRRGLHQLGGGAEEEPPGAVPLRQAPPGAVRRVHPRSASAGSST